MSSSATLHTLRPDGDGVVVPKPRFAQGAGFYCKKTCPSFKSLKRLASCIATGFCSCCAPIPENALTKVFGLCEIIYASMWRGETLDYEKCLSKRQSSQSLKQIHCHILGIEIVYRELRCMGVHTSVTIVSGFSRAVSSYWWVCLVDYSFDVQISLRHYENRRPERDLG